MNNKQRSSPAFSYRAFLRQLLCRSMWVFACLTVMSVTVVRAESLSRPTIVSVEITAPASSSSSSTSSSSGAEGGGIPGEEGSLREESIDRRNDEATRGEGGAAASSAQPLHPAPLTPEVSPIVPAASSASSSQSSVSSSVVAEPSVFPVTGSPVYGMCLLLGPLCVPRFFSWIGHTFIAVTESSSFAQSCVSAPIFPWLLFLLIILWIAFFAFWLGLRASDRGMDANPRFSRRFLPIHGSWWYTFNCIALILIICYAVLVILEMTGAAGTTVGVTVTSSSIAMDCTGDVSLGSLERNGDTGAYDVSRSATCTIYALTPAGYTLSWQVKSGSGGTATGKLISGNGRTIDPYLPIVASTPETWTVTSGSGAWGGRLSSNSTTVDTSVWGMDGVNEKWLNVGTGSFVIAERTSPTAGADTERIGFRVDLQPPLVLDAGIYSARVTFTITEK